MPADNEKLTADEVTALSISARLRSANLKKQVPADQYEGVYASMALISLCTLINRTARLRSGQEGQ